MYEVISVKGDSVRFRYGKIVFDVKIVNDNGKMKIKKPADIYFLADDFRVLVGMALEVYENQVVLGAKLNNEKTKEQ